MSREVTIDSNGRFRVSDDPDNVAATAVTLATAPQHVNEVDVALSPDGDGFSMDVIGAMYRMYDRDDLLPPFDDDPSLDPEKQELWMLVRDRDEDRSARRIVMTGDELRRLVRSALELRRAKKGV